MFVASLHLWRSHKSLFILGKNVLFNFVPLYTVYLTQAALHNTKKESSIFVWPGKTNSLCVYLPNSKNNSALYSLYISQYDFFFSHLVLLVLPFSTLVLGFTISYNGINVFSDSSIKCCIRRFFDEWWIEFLARYLWINAFFNVTLSKHYFRRIWMLVMLHVLPDTA